MSDPTFEKGAYVEVTTAARTHHGERAYVSHSHPLWGREQCYLRSYRGWGGWYYADTLRRVSVVERLAEVLNA